MTERLPMLTSYQYRFPIKNFASQAAVRVNSHRLPTMGGRRNLCVFFRIRAKLYAEKINRRTNGRVKGLYRMKSLYSPEIAALMLRIIPELGHGKPVTDDQMDGANWPRHHHIAFQQQ